MNSYPQKLSTSTNNLWTTRRSRAQVIHILASNLRYLLRSRRAVEPLRRLARMRRMVLSGVLCLATAIAGSSAKAVNNTVEIYKLYAHTKLLNAKEFHCVDLLWTKESQWNPRSDNKHSTAYGIPQLLKMKETNPFKQIDLGLRYIHHRHSTPCEAWAYWKKKGHY